VSAGFEEIDWRTTPLGEISLRRRTEPILGTPVFEVKLDDAFLMSSLFTAGEIALAELGLAQVPGEGLDVVVGGLGLGYTAEAVLRDPRVRTLRVVEALSEVIGWHERGLLPVSRALTSDPRCRLVHGDFFAIVADGTPFGSGGPDRVDAVLVDIDHSPRHLLDPRGGAFYTVEGQRRLAERIVPGGVYALWSDDPPDEVYLERMRQVFASCAATVVAFPNPLTGGEGANTVYVSTTRGGRDGAAG
jgi:spermidine synthase